MTLEITLRNCASCTSRSRLGVVVVSALLSLAIAAPAPAEEFSGFLEDYSGMKIISPNVLSMVAPGAEAKAANYDSIMIDQPEFLVADDSKYAGLKPDDIKLISDTLRHALVTKFERSAFRLVTSPGPTTLYLRTGITDVSLKKKRKRIVQFTPIGLVATIATSPLRDIMDKLDLLRYTFEAEMLDSSSGERYAAYVDRSRGLKNEKIKGSWEVIATDLDIVASRVECRLSNTKRGPDAAIDCFAKYPHTDAE